MSVTDQKTEPRRPIDRELIAHAEQLCRGNTHLPVAAATPRALEMYARFATTAGQPEFALACLEQAARMPDVEAPTLVALARALRQKGCNREIEALEVCERALALAPDDAAATEERCQTLLQLDRGAEALEAAAAAADRQTVCADLQRLHADMLLARGSAAEALQILTGLRDEHPSDARLHQRIGQSLLKLHRPADAASAFRAALQLKDDSPVNYCGLADALVQLGQTDEAIETLRTAASFHRRCVMVSRACVDLLEQLGRSREAVSAWCRLGADLAAEDRFEESRAAYQAAIARNSACLNARVRLGLAALELADPREAIEHFEVVLESQPRHKIANVGHGWASHLLGDPRRGWAGLQLGGRKKDPREFDTPAWSGGSLEGRTILLWADQALGDTIQFIRYAQLVKAAGARVLVECDLALLPLVERMPCVDLALGRGAPLPAFDEHAAISTLPAIFSRERLSDVVGSDSQIDIPGYEPLWSAPPEALAICRERLRAGCSHDDERFTVGLVWAGEPTRVNGRQKFAPLASMAPLAAVHGVRFVSLQQGPQTCELVAPPPGLRIESVLGAPDMRETAATIELIDLVVTVDTMVAHLSGALGQRTWTVLPYAADWRWGRDETTSWYPSMKLFRQPRARDWPGLFTEVATALQSLVESHDQRRRRCPHGDRQEFERVT